MKLVSIEMIGFGKWTNKTFQFSEGNQLIFGENETGKSTIYQFIQAIFFGFPTKSKRNKDYQPKDGVIYGGSVYLFHPTYGNVRVERFKGKNKGQAKVYYQQQVYGEKFLEQMLHPLTKELFQSVFTFQAEQLNDLNKLQEDELQTLLLSLGISGSQQLLAARERYTKKAQNIYKGKGTQPPLNQKLLEFEALEQKINDKKQQENQFSGVLDQLSMIEQELKKKQQERNQLKEKVHISEQQVMNIPLYEELQRINDHASELDKYAIEAVQHKELLAIYQKYQFLSEEMSRLTHQLIKDSDNSNESQLYQYYLKEDEIRELVNQRYEIEKLANELDWENQALIKNKQEMRGLEAKWDWSEEQAPELFLADDKIQELSNQSIQYTLDIQKIEQEINTLDEEINQQTDLEKAQSVNRNDGSKTKKGIKKVNMYLLVFAVVFFIGSFFLNGFLRYMGIGLGIIISGLGLLPLFFSAEKMVKQDGKHSEKKAETLDFLVEKKIELEHKKKDLIQQEYVFNQNLEADFKKAGFGRMNRVDLLVNHRNDFNHYQMLRNVTQDLIPKIDSNRLLLNDYEILMERYVNKLGISDCTVQEQIQKMSAFVDQMESLRFKQNYEEDAYLNQQIRDIKHKKEQLTHGSKSLLQAFNIRSIEQIPIIMKKYQDAKQQKKRLQELKTVLGTLYAGVNDVAEIYQKNEILMEQMKKLDLEIQTLQSKEQKLLYTKQQMMIDGTLDELYQRRELLKNQIEELATKWTSHLLASNIIIDLLTELSDNQLPMLLAKASRYFCILTQEKYTALQLYEGQLIAICPNQSFFSLQDLSTGTKDQLIMALRFGFLSLYENRMICPIIIDDGWLYYDSVRKKILAEILKTFANKQQIICFSSDKEMLQYYKELNQPIMKLT